MADRRMFSKSIVLTDAFLDMPMSARCLYFTLGMLADDDGFVGSPKSIMRQCGASIDDMNILLAKRFVLGFESGVIVIKHWRINNYLQNDRHKDTTYVEEMGTLTLDKKGSYIERNRPEGQLLPGMDTACIQTVSESDNQNRLGKDRLYPPSVPKGTSSPQGDSAEKRRFTKPTLDEVREYCSQRGNRVDPEVFYDFYESKGWKVGNQSMKDWRAAVRTWEKSESRGLSKGSGNARSFRPRDINGQYDDDVMEEVTEL